MAQPTEGIKVVDAEPQPTAVPTQNASMNANALLNNTLDGFATLSSRFNPFAQKLNKGLGQVRQVIYIYIYIWIYKRKEGNFLNIHFEKYAQEKLGTAENVTELPQEYKDLEKVI